MSDLTESLGLDVSEALSAVDSLEERLTSAAEAAQDALSAAFTASLDDLQALADLGAAALAEGVSTGLSDGADEGVAAVESAVEGLEPTVDVDVEIEDSAIGELESAIEAASTTVDVGVDASEVAVAEEDVQGLIAAEQQAEQVITISAQADGLADAEGQVADLGGGAEKAQDQTGNLGVEMGELGAVSAVASGQLSGTAGIVKGLPGGFGLAAVAGGAFAGALTGLVNKAINADAASTRFKETLGSMAGEVESLAGTVPGLDKNLGDLALSTGSSASAIREAITTFVLLGRSAGATEDQIAGSSKQLVVLANYLSATNPKLGTADELITKLGGALVRGGRFAANFGLDVGTSADVAARAGEMYGKAGTSASFFEKQTAGLAIVFEKLGPTMAAGIDEGVDRPIVKLRQLEAELTKVLVTGSKPLIQPFVDALIALQPVLIGAAGLFSSLASGVFPIFAAQIGAIGKVLGALAELLDNRFAQALVATAGGFLAAQKSASLLLTLIPRIASGLASIASATGLNTLADKLASFAGGAKAAQVQTAALTATTRANATAQSALAVAIGEAAVASTEGAALQAAYNEQQAAGVAVAEARIAVARADAAATEATAAVKAGEVGAVDALTVAQGQQAAAASTLLAATERLAAAEGQYVVALDATVAADTVKGASLEALSVKATAAATAQTEAAAASTSAASSAGGLSAVMGPLAILVGVAGAAWALWSSSSKAAEEATKKAAESLSTYREELGLTNSQLSTLDASTAARSLEAAGLGAKRFKDALSDEGIIEAFNSKALSLGDAGLALDGNVEAAKRFRQSLVDAGEIDFKGSGDALAKFRRDFVETGVVSDATLKRMKPIAGQFVAQAEAAEKARKELVEKAKAEISGGNASETSAVQSLAAAGALGDLGKKGEIAARSLLAKADAAKASAKADIDAAVATEQYGDAVGVQIDAVNRATEALAAGETANVGDFGAARALAASQAFSSLPDDTQEATQALIDYSDEARTAAQENGDLVSATGEVGSSFVSLNGLLDDAIDKWESLSGARGNVLKSERDLRASFDETTDEITESDGRMRDWAETNQVAEEAARDNANAVQGTLQGIREYGELLLKQGTSTEDVKAKMKLLTAAFVEQVAGVGANREEVNELVAAEGLLPDQIDQGFKATGLDAVTRQLQILNLTMLGLPPEAVVRISAIDDATEQAEAIEETIAGLPPDKQVAVRAILDLPSVAAAEGAVEALSEPVEAAIKLGVEPAAARQAEKEIAFISKATGVEIEVTANTIAAVADLDAAAEPRTAPLNADDQGTANRASGVLDRTARQREALILAQAANTTQTEAALALLARRRSALIDVTILTKRGTAATGTTADSLDQQLTGGTAHGGFIGPGGVQQFASGGVWGDDLWERQRKWMSEGAKSDTSGFHAPGSYAFVRAEDSTAGEYMISRDATKRAHNEGILDMAARDFGMRLIPKGEAVAPVVNVDVARDAGSADLLGALGTIGTLLERNLRRPTIGQNIEKVEMTADPGSGTAFSTDLDDLVRGIG